MTFEQRQWIRQERSRIRVKQEISSTHSRRRRNVIMGAEIRKETGDPGYDGLYPGNYGRRRYATSH